MRYNFNVNYYNTLYITEYISLINMDERIFLKKNITNMNLILAIVDQLWKWMFWIKTGHQSSHLDKIEVRSSTNGHALKKWCQLLHTLLF